MQTQIQEGDNSCVDTNTERRQQLCRHKYRKETTIQKTAAVEIQIHEVGSSCADTSTERRQQLCRYKYMR